MEYAYVIGGFHGEVVELQEQVDPQPRATPVREALPALRGAEITGFEKTGENSYQLSYKVDGDARVVRYSIQPDGTYPFEFDNGREGSSKEVYTARQGGGGGPGRPGGQGKGPGKGAGACAAEAKNHLLHRPRTGRARRDLRLPKGKASRIPTGMESSPRRNLRKTPSASSPPAAATAAHWPMPCPKPVRSSRRMDTDHNGKLETPEWQAGEPPAPAAPPRAEMEAGRKPMGSKETTAAPVPIRSNLAAVTANSS